MRCVMILREVGCVRKSSSIQSPRACCVSPPNDYRTYTMLHLPRRSYGISSAVELVLSDDGVDIIANQIDVSIRIKLADRSTLQARRIKVSAVWSQPEVAS